MIEPEEYNQYGELAKKIEPIKPYMRTMSAYDQHRIHETKDIFNGDCTYCADKAKRPSPFVCSKCKEDCYTRDILKDHWLLEH